MRNIYLFEAGATKTTMHFQVDGETGQLDLPGYNPNRANGAFEIAIQEGLKLNENSELYFYGAGLKTEKNKDLVKLIFDQYSFKKIQVFDDIFGAARAVFHSAPGVVCILGTGGLAAFFDGKTILKRRGGYGYLIDDHGGGFELGKRILSAWLNDDLNQVIDGNLTELVGFKKDEVVAEVYQNLNLDLIAQIPKIAENSTEETLKKIVSTYFEQFIENDVLPLAKEFSVERFSTVGSMGTAFYKEINSAAAKFNLKIDQCIQNPAKRLFDFHKKDA